LGGVVRSGQGHLGYAQEYLDLAISAKDRGEREFYERIAELYLKIAQVFEAMMGG
jgi:hypothetical protein